MVGGHSGSLSSDRTRTTRGDLREIGVAHVQRSIYEVCASSVPLASERAAHDGRTKNANVGSAKTPGYRLLKERASRRSVSIVSPILIVDPAGDFGWDMLQRFLRIPPKCHKQRIEKGLRDPPSGPFKTPGSGVGMSRQRFKPQAELSLEYRRKSSNRTRLDCRYKQQIHCNRPTDESRWRYGRGGLKGLSRLAGRE